MTHLEKAGSSKNACIAVLKSIYLAAAGEDREALDDALDTVNSLTVDDLADLSGETHKNLFLVVCMLEAAASIKSVTFPGSPAETDDEDFNFAIGCEWKNSSTGEKFVLIDATDDAAVWDSLNKGAVNEKTVTIASAGTTNLATAAGRNVTVTGTTTITALGTVAAGAKYELVFGGVLTFTHNGTSLILPTGASITTAAGDCATMLSLGSGNWRCINYQRANGMPLADFA